MNSAGYTGMQPQQSMPPPRGPAGFGAFDNLMAGGNTNTANRGSMGMHRGAPGANQNGYGGMNNMNSQPSQTTRRPF